MIAVIFVQRPKAMPSTAGGVRGRWEGTVELFLMGGLANPRRAFRSARLGVESPYVSSVDVVGAEWLALSGFFWRGRLQQL